MKIGLPLVTLSFLCLAGCDAPTSPEARGTESPLLWRAEARAMGSAEHGRSVALPFRVRAFTVLEALAPDPRCGAPPRFLNTQVGEGNGTHLGAFEIRFEFCVDATDLLDDGMLTEGESIPYDNGVGTIVAANGDELHLAVSGAVLPSPDPDYDFEFQDPFEIVGGTGRFEGAGGAGMTDSYVDQATDRTDHTLVGTLVLRVASR